MITKTYESANSVIANWTLVVNGRPRIVNFTAISAYEGSRTGHGSILTTSDENLQRAIESSRIFGSRVKLIKTTDVAATPKKPVEKEKVEENKEKSEEENKTVIVPSIQVDSPNEAREYMHVNYGMEMRKMPNIRSIINAAKERNVVFECLNDK